MSVRTFDILIVDDDGTSRRVLEQSLRKLGYTNIETTADGLEALHRIVSKHYDLIFLDNEMPKLSGMDLLRRCRGVSILSQTAVIMLTARVDDDILRQVRQEGLKLDGIMVKPLEKAVLMAKLDRLEAGGTVVPSAVSRNAETGAFLSINIDRTGDVTSLIFFGALHQEDKQHIKDIPDRIAMMTVSYVIIDMRNVVSIDEFGLGMLLLINGVACLSRKTTYLLLDKHTIKSRLEALGISVIMRIIEDESEVVAIAHLGGPGPGAAPDLSGQRPA